MNHHKRIKAARSIAVKAGKLILEGIKDHTITASKKGDTSFVTEWDKRTEKYIIEALKTKFDGDGFLGEEGDSTQSTTGFSWVIDPIDGTTNFSKAQPFWAISIALVENNEVVGGVIYAPLFKKFYVSCKGEGVIDDDNKSLHVSQAASLDACLATLEIPSRPHLKEISLKLYSKALHKISRIRMLGMAAYNLTQIAAGQFDLYISVGQKTWDMAAGVLMVREAGGKAVDIDGEEWTLESESLVAGNEKVVEEFIRGLKK